MKLLLTLLISGCAAVASSDVVVQLYDTNGCSGSITHTWNKQFGECAELFPNSGYKYARLSCGPGGSLHEDNFNGPYQGTYHLNYTYPTAVSGTCAFKDGFYKCVIL